MTNWKDLLKAEKEMHIVWLSPRKGLAWIEGHGPYQSAQIYAYMRKNPEIEFIESISDNA
tara:strand:- start:3734 stop:3913 length:180 start_codon:yes stop_codon:yes gene_type:complete